MNDFEYFVYWLLLTVIVLLWGILIQVSRILARRSPEENREHQRSNERDDHLVMSR